MRELNPLTLRFRPGLRLSDRAFWKLCAANPELRLERTAGGSLEVMPPAGSDTGRRNASLTGQLANWAEADGRGVVFDSSAGFTLPNGAIRSPDATWIAGGRWEALSCDQQEGFAPLCPDFVAELRSRPDRMGFLRKKMREYIRQGARLGWLLDLVGGGVEIFRPDGSAERLVRPATLSGEDVLPGFVLDLKGILFD